MDGARLLSEVHSDRMRGNTCSCNMENSNPVSGKNFLTVRVLKHWTGTQSSGVISILGDIQHLTGQSIKQPHITWPCFIPSNINYPMNTKEVSAIKSLPVVLFIWMKIWQKNTGRKLWLKTVIIWEWKKNKIKLPNLCQTHQDSWPYYFWSHLALFQIFSKVCISISTVCILAHIYKMLSF